MISQPCVTNNRIEHRASSIARYFSHFFKLLTDYRSLEAIDGNACLAVARRKRACLAVARRRRVKPVPLFALELRRV